MRTRLGQLWVIAFMSATVMLAGCNSEGKRSRPPMAKVKGTLSYKGKPVSDASITFVLEGMPRSSSGVTDGEGRFKLTTYDTNDGAFLGTNKVVVSRSTVAATGKDPSQLRPEDLEKAMKEGTVQEASKIKSDIPAKYSDPIKTPLKVTVEAGNNEKTIELED